MKKLISLLLALVLLCGIAVAEEDTVLMTIGDMSVIASDVEDYAYLLYYYGYADENDYEAAFNYLIDYTIAPVLLVPDVEGYFGEEYADKYAELETEYNEYINEYVDYFTDADMTEEQLAALYAEAEEYYGGKDAYILDNLRVAAFIDMTEGIEVELTEDELWAFYMKNVVEPQMSQITSVYMYEYYQYMGYSLNFVPEGYRGILHILLSADSALTDAYDAAEDELAQNVAAQAVIDSLQPTLDEIYARFNAGESFESLIAEYNTDPGMTGDTLTEGYKVHAESMTYVQEFTDGAFSEKMQQPGDISDPVVTSYGVHVLYYLKDIPAGAVAMTEDEKEYYGGYALSEKQFDAAEQLLKEFGITYTDAYFQYMDEEIIK